MNPDKNYDFVFRAAAIPPGQSGTMISFTPEEAGWKTMGFTARRLAKGDTWKGTTGDNEAAIDVLSGTLTIDFGDGPQSIGKRENVFSGYPSAVYLPCQTSYELRAETVVEFAETRVHSSRKLKPRVYWPSDIGSELRGNGDYARQVLRIIRPEAEADRLMMNEVFTPSGNWSTYPPHKHEVHSPPGEYDLDEIYYFRIDHPDGYALVRLYDSAGTRDVTATVRDGDLVVLRDGYHTVAAAPGYRICYLAVLAGSARALAATTDPRYAHLINAPVSTTPPIPVVSNQ
jgi:5-deoxy-glucuronate isomerase